MLVFIFEKSEFVQYVDAYSSNNDGSEDIGQDPVPVVLRLQREHKSIGYHRESMEDKGVHIVCLNAFPTKIIVPSSQSCD